MCILITLTAITEIIKEAKPYFKYLFIFFSKFVRINIIDYAIFSNMSNLYLCICLIVQFTKASLLILGSI